MRRAFPIILLFTLFWAWPSSTAAVRSESFDDVDTFIECDTLATEDGRQVAVFAEISQEFGTAAAMGIWAPDADIFFEVPIAFSRDATATLSADGSTLNASYELWTIDETMEPPFVDPIGTAALTAELTPIGDPVTFDERDKFGNRQSRTSGTRQALEVSGELVMPDDEVIDLTGCFGAVVDYSFFSNNPARESASLTFRNESLQLSCFWEVDGTFVDLFAFADEFGTFSAVSISIGESFAFGSDEDPTLTRSDYSAAFELRNDAEEVVGSATASATLTATGKRVHFLDRFDHDTFKLSGEVVSVDGALDINLDGGLNLPMDDESCSALDGRSMEHAVNPRGPKAKPLDNDTPDGALALAIGDSVSVLTGATAFDPEATCVGGTDPDTGEDILFPITNTAWWTFTGTGGDATVSTVGSDFDTILGVYRLDGADLVQVACVDDTEATGVQAEATIGTQADATYYIQAGGYGGNTGKLVVSVN